MGGGPSKAPVSELFANVDTKLTDGIKKTIASTGSGKPVLKQLIKEHIPSPKPHKLQEEIDSASKLSKLPSMLAPTPTFIDYSIFGDGDLIVDINTAVLNFQTSVYRENRELDCCLGSMYGMLIGDSWGHLLEFCPVQYEEEIIKALDAEPFVMNSADRNLKIMNRFGLKAGQYTDDSSMGLCLADSLLTSGHVNCIDLRKRFVMWWYLGYNNAFRYDMKNRESVQRQGRSVGLGGQISYSLKSFLENPKEEYARGEENMSGNGSIMRLCPLPIFYRHSELKFLVAESMKQSFTTHSGIQSAECAALLSFIIVAAIKSDAETGKEFLDDLEVEEMMEYLVTDAVKCIARSKPNKDWIEDNFNKEAADQYWNWKDTDYRYSPTRSAINPGYVGGYACDNLAMALHCVYHGQSFEGAILRCINRCGDADTVGSVTGQIAGALYGVTTIPNSALECTMKWDPRGEIPMRVFKMFDLDNS